ncbi:PD40 domain-containing protein [bacterium]|nr:PD40 domain-containing protein [bacterium]
MPRCRSVVVALASIAILWTSPALAGDTGYCRFPTIHGETVVFASEGDLFSVPVAGGRAMRLTTHEGDELYPKLSPDGKWLAYSAEYQGNTDVYVMPAEGGEPRRLTFHPASDLVVAWRPDSSAVVFRSDRDTAFRETFLYEVPVVGGETKKIEVGMGSLASFSPDGKEIAFNCWSTEFRTWKRYRGGLTPHIWVGNPREKTFRKITDWEGTDDFPMWMGERIYFLSDRAGRSNVFSCRPDGSDVKQHTQHADFDARFPDAHGGRVVYSLGGDIWVLDVETNKSRKIEISLPSDRLRVQRRFEDASKTVESYALDRTGKRVALATRGAIFVAPPREGHVLRLLEGTPARRRAPAFSPDGKEIAAITDETGEQELFLSDSRGSGKSRVLTHREKGWIFDPVWSPDGAWIAYSDLTCTLLLVDAKTGETRTVDTNPVWEIREYSFSPDAKWLAFTKDRDGHRRALFLYDIAKGKTHAISAELADDGAHAWDPRGDYLFFVSKRSFDPLVTELDWDFYLSNTGKVCAAVLAKDGLPPGLPDELYAEKRKKDKEKEKPKDDKGGKKDEKEQDDEAMPPLPVMTVDPEGLASRVVELPGIAAGNYSALAATAEGKVFYLAEPQEALRGVGEEPRRSLHVYDLKTKKAEVFIPALRDFVVSANGKKLAYRVKTEILLADADKKPDGKAEGEHEAVDPAKLPLSVNPKDEWAQIFVEAWRLQRDFYWAENMAGVDWKAVREKYAPLVPRISTRRELNDLVGQMIAELGTSHTYVWGGDTEHGKSLAVGLLGADLAPDAAADAHRVKRVLRPETWETEVEAPLAALQARVEDGDLLLAIDGRELHAQDDVSERLAGRAGAWVELTVARKADKSDARKVLVKTIATERELRYRDACRRAREHVEQRSGGRIGYFHLPDMGHRGLVRFIQGYYSQLRKEALVVDERYNGGGNVSSMIIARLKRKVWARMRPRRGLESTFPDQTHEGPKVVLVNQHSGSDGDIFPESFKLNGLGLVIGTRTWGGVVGIRADKPFIDFGVSTQPEFAWWEPKRGWNLENRGVEPDIVIDNRPEDEVSGKDPQLDRAIDELLKQLPEKPAAAPAPPPVPDKSPKR